MNESMTGAKLLQNKLHNKSTAFSREEREKYKLNGLLPYAVVSQDAQRARALENINRKAYDIERYVFLSALQDRNERLFYDVIIHNIEKMLPIIYTPTVGQACKEFSHIYRQEKGFYITPEDKGNIESMLENWPEKDIRVIVVTDGSRILGLGDLGANGIGIPIGKLALYTALAGIHPQQCLPVMLDFGTDNDELLKDMLYLGYPHRRNEDDGGEEYYALVDEFIQAVQKKYPLALIQFEDFLTPKAYGLLKKYFDKVLCFNDDIQGTAAVALAGVYASTRITKIKFTDLKIMFLGAGSAATGIGDLMVTALEEAGLSNEEARKRLWYVDVNGLVVKSRTDLMDHNLPYAHEEDNLSFIEAIDTVKPNILFGATGSAGTFTKEVIEHISAINEYPAIFALSNPTSKAECTAEQAYQHSKGKAIFTSGSPFDPVNYQGTFFKPGQGNNAYIFPGVGLGAICANSSRITEQMFLIAAKTLADQVAESDIAHGSLYPPLNDIRKVSHAIALKVAEEAYATGLARNDKPEDLSQYIEDYMYQPHY